MIFGKVAEFLTETEVFQKAVPFPFPRSPNSLQTDRSALACFDSRIINRTWSAHGGRIGGRRMDRESDQPWRLEHSTEPNLVCL